MVSIICWEYLLEMKCEMFFSSIINGNKIMKIQFKWRMTYLSITIMLQTEEYYDEGKEVVSQLRKQLLDSDNVVK